MNQTDENDTCIRVDLLVEESHTKRYIEMQNTLEMDFLRSLLYTPSKIIVYHQKLRNNFTNISKVISN